MQVYKNINLHEKINKEIPRRIAAEEFLLCRLLVVGPVLKWLALCIYLFITVPTTCSRPSIEMVGFITVPTTCSRPSIEMVGFMYLFIYLCISPCSLP